MPMAPEPVPEAGAALSIQQLLLKLLGLIEPHPQMALIGHAAGTAPEQQFALELSTAVMALKLTPKDLVLVLRTKEDCLLLLVRLPVVVVVSVQHWDLVG